MHFFTLPNMAEEQPLRICKATVELLTEREHLDTIELAILGGVTSVFEVGASLQTTTVFPTTTPRRSLFLVSASTLIIFMVA